MQETPESIPEGETPHTVTLACYDELVDVAKPGDRVEITGAPLGVAAVSVGYVCRVVWCLSS